MLGLALRFAPMLGAETARIARVQELRAGRPPRGMGERLQRLRATVVPALVGSLERAERVALALEARHYRLRPVGMAGGLGERGSRASRESAVTARLRSVASGSSCVVVPASSSIVSSGNVARSHIAE